MTLPFKIAVIAALLILGVALLIVRTRAPALNPEAEGFAKNKKKRRALFAGAVLCLWMACGLIIGVFAQPAGELHVDVFAPRVSILGFIFSTSVVISWIAMVIVVILALCIRIFALPRFTEKPRGVQLLVETAVGALHDYAKERAGFVSEGLVCYMLTLALFLVSCAGIELFSFRPPTADLVMTLSLALCTFALINYYGIKKKGVSGRVKSFTHPSPVIFPFKLLSDIATPVSLACRLYGNMLGGMIVMHLVYMALGAFGVGIPAVLGLYFNAFHPLIQVFIFITLSLTFIGEAAE